MENVRKYLKKERIKQGLTQSQLAEKTGIVQNTFHRIENKHISTKTLERVLDGLEISVHTTTEIAEILERELSIIDKWTAGRLVLLEDDKAYNLEEWVKKVFTK